MGTLVLDIETASPFEEPPDGANETQYFEWVAVGLAYVDALDDQPETTVLFRRGDWADEHTVDLFERVFDWTEALDVDRVLTYNGTWFDVTHLCNWARELDDAAGPALLDRTHALFENHVDVALAAADAYADELWDEQSVLPDWKAYELAGIDADSVWYEDYDFPDTYLDEIDGKTVQGRHVGRVIGERYVDNVAAAIESTRVHRELTRLLEDYCESDVADLVALYTALGGPSLDDEYRRPPSAVD